MELLKLLIPFFSSGIIVIILMPLFIKMMRIHQEGQQIRTEGPKWQDYKAGTPTMGGVIFLLALVLTNIWVSSYFQSYSISLILINLVMILFGLIGFMDDFIKLRKHRNLGLKAGQKASLQVLFALLYIGIAYFYQLPHDLALGDWIIHSRIIFLVFALIWIVGFSNAVNLTDGLDGLVGGLAAIAYSAYGYIAYQQQNWDILIACLSVVGALVAFLAFNHKPAKIFMGDVGSLALGAGLAVLAITLNVPWSLLWIGIVFVIETASVMLQVAVFRRTHKRIFKMTPIHHHFELSGWSEWQIVLVFWLVGLIAAISYLVIFIG